LNGYKLHFSSSRHFNSIRLILAILLILAYLISLVIRWPIALRNELQLFMPILMILYVLIYPLNAPNREVSKLMKDKDRISPISGCITDTGDSYETRLSKSEHIWTLYRKYKIGGNIVLLYLDKDIFRIFPKRFFKNNEEWESFKKLVEVKVPVDFA